MTEPREAIECHVCKKQNKIMKRCTKCQSIYYCSRECQVTDWKTHKQFCQTKQSPAYTDDGSIFTDTASEQSHKDLKTKESEPQQRINFQKAANDLKQQKEEKNSVIDIEGHKSVSENSYLHQNQYLSDLPTFDETQPFCEITVKCNKEKVKIQIQNSWNGNEIFKIFSNKLKIPLEKIKVIHKGKCYTSDTILSVMTNKATFQLIGEQAANEDGLYIGDVDLLMKQMGVDRNDAVKALRKSGDVVDAILELGNKF